MAILKCKMCGGDLSVSGDSKIIECEYCGTSQTIPAADDEKRLNLFNRATRLRINGEFDKAAAIYESIVAEFPEDAEGYWGLVLCNYGIEYVDDPATAKKIPTCHRAAFESILKDENYNLALEYADILAQKVYRDEAREIERIREEILSISKNEQPYDVFICYKETDDRGERTIDSVIAQDVYEALTAKGYKVFFAKISLEDKLGRQYEPYIFAALNSAKVMLSFGTKYEYFHAVWVKNEWSRFLKLMAKDKTKVLIPCYKDMDAYDLPDEFKALQAQDMGKVGAIQDLIRGIEKIITAESKTETVQSANNPTVNSLLERAFIFLEDGAWESADEYCEKVLDIEPKCANAYLGKLMAELNIKEKKGLATLNVPFDNNSNFQKALRFAEGSLKDELSDYVKAAEAVKAKAQTELELYRQKIRPIQKTICTDAFHILARKIDGEILTFGDNNNGECSVNNWDGIIALSTNDAHTVGLKEDGTALATGWSLGGRLRVKDWTDMVAVTAGASHTVGVKKDGTALSTGDNKYGQGDVGEWTDIADVAAGISHTVGLKKNGTVVATGDSKHGQCDTVEWSDIVEISAASFHTVGLKKDGTVVAAGDNKYGQCDVGGWRDIVAISASNSSTVGLKKDGTVLYAGKNRNGNEDLKRWTDIIAVATGRWYTVGVKKNGDVLIAGIDEDEYEIPKWKLFDNLDNLEQEREIGRQQLEKRKKEELEKRKAELEKRRAELERQKELEEKRKAELERQKELEAQRKAELEAQRKAELEQQKLIAERKAKGVCVHCGGSFKGLFTKKCSSCGKEKNY